MCSDLARLPPPSPWNPHEYWVSRPFACISQPRRRKHTEHNVLPPAASNGLQGAFLSIAIAIEKMYLVKTWGNYLFIIFLKVLLYYLHFIAEIKQKCEVKISKNTNPLLYIR